MDNCYICDAGAVFTCKTCDKGVCDDCCTIEYDNGGDSARFCDDCYNE